MEHRGQDRDIGLPDSTSYNPSQITQESPVKLPLAPIVSTPPDRRGTATASIRRGSAIFSPTQTLDQHLHPQHHHHHHHPQLNPPPPQQPQVLKDTNPDPDPSTPTTDGTSNSKTPASPPQPRAPPPQPQVPPAAASTPIRYRECQKNHAASMGGHVVDGCGEFMPSGEEGTAEALRCAACDCHRNFHRKEVEGEAQPSNYYPLNPNSGNNNSNRTPLIHSQTPPSLAAHQHHHHHHRHSHSYPQAFASGPSGPGMVNFGGAADESSSEDLNMFQSSAGGHAVIQPSFSGSKKRFRTKFSQEQKDRMQEFAEKLGWKIQKQDEEEVQQFCNETGVKRQVFKVWMHNNKQAMKKRQI